MNEIMRYTKNIIVDCEPYGAKKLFYPDSMEEKLNGQLLLKELESSWSSYWAEAKETTTEMAEQVLGIYDFNASFETHDFQMNVYDMRDWEDPEKVALWIQFIDSDSKTIVPVFDTTFRKLKVVRCQPVF